MRQAVGEICYEAYAADGFESLLLLQFFGNDDRIDFFTTFEERGHCDKYAPVRWHIKVFRPQQFDGLTNQSVIKDDAAEDGALSFGAVGKRTFERLLANR